jgi:hypothetical protein
MKIQFVFLLAVAFGVPLATAFNCTELNGEEYKVCNYIEDQNWPQSEKDNLIQDAIDSNDASLKGNFKPTLGKEIPCTIQLNKPEAITQIISDDNKIFLIDLSSISLFGYIIYAFLKKYYLLLNFL